jgi:hypothetical protein
VDKKKTAHRTRTLFFMQQPPFVERPCHLGLERLQQRQAVSRLTLVVKAASRRS